MSIFTFSVINISYSLSKISWHKFVSSYEDSALRVIFPNIVLWGPSGYESMNQLPYIAGSLPVVNIEILIVN